MQAAKVEKDGKEKPKAEEPKKMNAGAHSMRTLWAPPSAATFKGTRPPAVGTKSPASGRGQFGKSPHSLHLGG